MAKKSKRTKRTSRKRKSRSGPKRPKTKHAAAGPSPGVQNVAHAICKITDPFCHAAVGSKYPDSASMKTLAWDAEFFVTGTTDAQGRGAVIIGSDPGASLSFAQGFSTSTMAISATSAPTAVPGWSNWESSPGVTWRIVSMGLETRSTASSMTNQGSIGIAVVPSYKDNIIATGLNLDSMNFSENLRVSANSGVPIAAISYNDGITSKQMKQSVGCPVNEAASYGNDILIAYITGGPASTAAFQVRVVYHYELAFSTSSVFNTVATPSAVENTTVQTGSNYVKKIVDQVVVGGTKEVERRVHSTAQLFGQYLARAGAAAIGGYFGGPSGAIAGATAAGMIMDVD